MKYAVYNSLSLVGRVLCKTRLTNGPIKQINFSAGKSDGVEGAKNGRGSGEKSVEEN